MKSNKILSYHELVALVDTLQTEKKRSLSEGNPVLIAQDYRRLFDNATISIWNEDFTLVFEQINDLKKLNIPDIKLYLNQNREVLFSLLSKLKINSVNKATLKLFEAESDQEFLNNIQTTFGEGADNVSIDLIAAIWNNEKSFTSEVNYKTLKGVEFAALFSIHIPQTKLEQRTVPVTIQSIQALKDAESAKRISLIKLEQAQKIGHIGSWEWEWETDNAVWSDEMYRIYGVDKGEFNPTNENVNKTILDEGKNKMKNAVSRLLAGEVVDSFEYEIIRPNNEIRVLSIIGLQISGGVIFGVTQDITDRKKIENKLNEAQALAKIGSWLFNNSNQKIEWSDETFHLWGFDIKNGAPEYEALVNRIHSDDQELFHTAVDKAIKLGMPYDIEHRICLPSGEQKVARAICKPMLGVDGEVIGLAGTSQDITSNKLFEQAHIKNQRLKAMGEMASSIAHDFNNSLQEMMGNLEIVKFQKDLSEGTVEHLNNIGLIIGDVADRVSGLQKFSDTEHTNKNSKPHDFNTLIKESLNQSRLLWKDAMEKEGVRVNVITHYEKIPKINCTSGELKSAIYNLIKNSIEAMPEGGDLTIKTGLRTGGVYATFTDSGIGMNEETKLKIFEPFFTTKGFELGKGLGLSGVYSIVKKYGGDVAVTSSELEKGTTIEIVFPISNEDEIEVVSESKPKEKKIHSTLWVDDDVLISKSSCMLVESMGHKCTTVNSGEKALEFLNNSPCDIVFTDIGMPKMNGWELSDSIRDRYGDDIKIIAVTGWNIEESLREKHGIDLVVQKPFSLKELEKAFLLL
ncbi:MAG: signal transduction histidine kinase [Vicingaceae bacterium]|jgi:signal transduction histidine kinase